ncbi:MAG: hypothetical protein COW65_15855 [Cytophagales bacterium CG18_big_fil_WC_8_21_14_2_50_42_9]|nr:MAG: hypothetical protein COW65_15855 [Cytophagales bacterium CG18_big_fil_WC_8_21_14_2_50_42_9]
MLKSDSYRKGLYNIAVITSIGWGIISNFPVVTAPRPFPFPGISRNLPPHNFPQRESPTTEHMLLSAAGITLLMLCLWFMNILLDTRLRKTGLSYKARNISRYLLSYILTIFIYYACLSMISLLVANGRPLFFPLIVALTNNTIILVLMDLIILQKASAEIEVENTQLKMNSVIAQHQHLKHQLQPHFLFNSLTTLKSLIKRQPADAEEYLVRLSDLLRASISTDTQNIIPLKDELKLCIDYLEMQKVRFKNSFDYEISIPEYILQTGLMPVFSLQLLVENAIKHNFFTPEEPLHIRIMYDKNDCLVVWNNKKPKQFIENPSGIGLKNLLERYQVIAGHGIHIMESDKSFSVELKVLNK